ncbi:MAG TPA: hypothetical protein VK457_10325 [Chloroflexota bacterium]|nr:hypothetical protein [Chloroflexota bacterium]
MNDENEAEFEAVAARLKEFRYTDLPERFRMMAHTMIVPALEEVAERVRAMGHECHVSAAVDEPIPAAGQTVYLNFDIRFAPGENSLCIRLVPGESVVRIETPGAGSVVAQHVPLVEFTHDNVQRVAINYLRRALQ